MLGGPPIDLTKGVKVRLVGIERTAVRAALADLADSGVQERQAGPELRIRIASSRRAESYQLSARNGAVDIVAADLNGALYALESLAQQASRDGGGLLTLEIYVSSACWGSFL